MQKSKINQYTGDTMTSDIIIVSTPYLPGYKITKTIGFTWGLIVRSRGLGRNITAGLRSIIGGEIHEYTGSNQSVNRHNVKEHPWGKRSNKREFDSSERSGNDRAARIWYSGRG